MIPRPIQPVPMRLRLELHVSVWRTATEILAGLCIALAVLYVREAIR